MPQNSAEKFYNRCLDYGVSINYRTKYIYKTCGLRIGTQEISRYGWDNAEMLIIAEILRDIRDTIRFPKISLIGLIFFQQRNNCAIPSKKSTLILYIMRYITVNFILHFSDSLFDDIENKSEKCIFLQ